MTVEYGGKKSYSFDFVGIRPGSHIGGAGSNFG